MTTKEQIEVMQAFENGKKIQYRRKIRDEWIDTSCPGWDWIECEYRIKSEEPKCRPYKDMVEMVEDFKSRFARTFIPNHCMPLIWINKKDADVILLITEFYKNDYHHCIGTSAADYTLDELFDYYTYLDGTPCGKYVG